MKYCYKVRFILSIDNFKLCGTYYGGMALALPLLMWNILWRYGFGTPSVDVEHTMEVWLWHSLC